MKTKNKQEVECWLTNPTVFLSKWHKLHLSKSSMHKILGKLILYWHIPTPVT